MGIALTVLILLILAEAVLIHETATKDKFRNFMRTVVTRGRYKDREAKEAEKAVPKTIREVKATTAAKVAVKPNRLAKCPYCGAGMAMLMYEDGKPVLIEGEQAWECNKCLRRAKESQMPIIAERK